MKEHLYITNVEEVILHQYQMIFHKIVGTFSEGFDFIAKNFVKVFNHNSFDSRQIDFPTFLHYSKLFTTLYINLETEEMKLCFMEQLFEKYSQRTWSTFIDIIEVSMEMLYKLFCFISHTANFEDNYLLCFSEEQQIIEIKKA